MRTCYQVIILYLLLLGLPTNSFSQTTIKMIKHSGGTYELPVEINGVLKINFIFDSGASEVSISPDIALTLIKTGTIKDEDWLEGKYFQFADGSVAKSYRFKIHSLNVGGHYLHDVPASITNSLDAPLLLGQSALSKLGKIQIDYAANTLIILDGYVSNNSSSSNNSNINSNESEYKKSWFLESATWRINHSPGLKSSQFLNTGDRLENLTFEVYQRLNYEIRASHILINCSLDASPNDTTIAFNKSMELRIQISKGGDFSLLARQSSDDPSANENGGDLGYFTSLQMVYQFETVAYDTKVGSISMPVRTRFGYHLIKVNDVRPNSGEVRVEHIMSKFLQGGTIDDSLMAINKIYWVAHKLRAGENFEDLARKYSDDQGSAKSGGGLPEFGTGRMLPEFEKAAFDLITIGDYSDPIRTSYGWHIIKLIEKTPLKSYEFLREDLKTKVQKDSRYKG